MEQRTYAEQIVKCKKTGKTFVTQIFAIVLAVVLLTVVSLIPAIASLAPALIVVILVLTFLLIRGMNIEYEYTIVESRIDIDVIRGKSGRKRMVSVDSKNFEVLALAESRDELLCLKKSVQTVYSAVSNEKDQNCWYALFSKGGEEGKTLLIFQPNERVMDIMLRYVPPRNVKEPSKYKGAVKE